MDLPPPVAGVFRHEGLGGLAAFDVGHVVDDDAQPSDASLTAMAWPMPEEDPVTMATFP